MMCQTVSDHELMLSSQYMPISEVRERPQEDPIERLRSVMDNTNATVLLLVMCSQISDLVSKVSDKREEGQTLVTV